MSDYPILDWSSLTERSRQWFKHCYAEIQGSRTSRRDAGFETGPATMIKDGSPWFRNVDPLPSFKAWMEQVNIHNAI